MPQGRPLEPAKRAAIIADLKAEKLCNQIAREHGVSPSTVSKIAQENGRDFERSKTKRATESRTVDHHADRIRLAGRHLKLSEKILDYYDTLNTDDIAAMPAPTVAALLGINTDKFKALLPPDTDQTRHADVDKWLDDISGAA